MTLSRREAHRRRARRQRAAKVALVGVLPALAVLAVVLQPPPATPGHELPDYAMQDPQVAEAYAFAASDQGWILQHMACYCGCGGDHGHDSNLACFIRPGGAGFEKHGSQCGVCVDVALTAKQMYARGTSLHDLRTALDARWAGYPPTDTPIPP